ncbi:hypothetical protein [Streptomyces sp. NBC_01456]|uniref:hypothetical protein n=1 Tax=unclassified Streptomyces TaxID=2593676 RepID=UPI003FCC6D6A
MSCRDICHQFVGLRQMRCRFPDAPLRPGHRKLHVSAPAQQRGDLLGGIADGRTEPLPQSAPYVLPSQ